MQFIALPTSVVTTPPPHPSTIRLTPSPQGKAIPPPRLTARGILSFSGHPDQANKGEWRDLARTNQVRARCEHAELLQRKMLLYAIGVQRFCLDPARRLRLAICSLAKHSPRKFRLHFVSLRMTRTAKKRRWRAIRESPLQVCALICNKSRISAGASPRPTGLCNFYCLHADGRKSRMTGRRGRRPLQRSKAYRHIENKIFISSKSLRKPRGEDHT